MNFVQQLACSLVLSALAFNIQAKPATTDIPVPVPYTSTTSPQRWENQEFSYSIPAFDATWSVNPELYLPPSDLKVAREQVSFSANADLTRFELTAWDKNPGQSLKKWFNSFGKGLCGTVGVTRKNIKTPAGEQGIWVNVEATVQAPQTELFFLASRDQVFCLRYLNKDGGANRTAFEKLCFGFVTSISSDLPKGTPSETIGAAAVPSAKANVASCGGVVDACQCAGNNPYPCCANGSNCTWGAWDKMCCNWGYAAGNWGNAETWGVYAQAAGNWVQSAPTVGAVGCRRVHSDTPYGHVATVLSISGDNVYCIQMNCNVGGAGWSYQTFHKSYFTGGYITRTNPTPPPPAVLNSSPDSVSWGANRIDVVVRRSNDRVYHRSFNGSAWSAWKDLGGLCNGSPSICSMNAGRLDVFMRGYDNKLWHNLFANNTWYGWENLGDTLSSEPDCTSRGAGKIDVVFRGSNDDVWHRWMDGYNWVGYRNLGMDAKSAPTICTMGGGRLDIFFQGYNDHLWHNAGPGNNTWWGWEDLGDVLTAGPDCVSRGAGKIDVVFRGSNNNVWHRWMTNYAWAGYNNLGMWSGYEPTIAAWSPTRLDAFFTGGNGSLWHNAGPGNNTWWGWEDLGKP